VYLRVSILYCVDRMRSSDDVWAPSVCKQSTMYGSWATFSGGPDAQRLSAYDQSTLPEAVRRPGLTLSDSAHAMQHARDTAHDK
jgi:hypothetical protein